MSTTLDVWVNSGSLQRHTTSPQEVGDLLSVVQRDLAASQTAGLSDDWKLTIAYNAALQAAKVALAAAGYRVSSSEKGHHYRIVESLRYTVEAPAADVDLLQRMKKKRHVSDYEVAGAAPSEKRKRCWSSRSGFAAWSYVGWRSTTLNCWRSSAASRSTVPGESR